MKKITILVMGIFLIAGCSYSGTVEPGSVGSRVSSPEPTSTQTKAVEPALTTTADATPMAVPEEEKRPKVIAPQPGASWQIQFTGSPTLGGVDVVDVDGNDTSADTVAQIRSVGGYTICYFNAGAYEDWRSDVDKFPAEVLGKDMEGWDGEKWLDVRRVDILLPIMTARMDECASKGFNAVDPDNVDGWGNETGFPLSKDDSKAYVIALAKAAHSRGLAFGLKNALGLIPEVVDNVDFAINEQCLAFDECSLYQPFVDRGKAILHIEYQGRLKTICAKRPEGFSTIRKNMELDASRESC